MPPLNRQDKIIAGIQLARSLLGALWLGFTASGMSYPWTFLFPNLALVALGIAAAIGSLRQRRWGILGGLLFFALQLIQVSHPPFGFSFTLGLNVSIGGDWGATYVSVNLLALIMFLWSWRRAHVRLARQDSPITCQ